MSYGHEILQNLFTDRPFTFEKLYFKYVGQPIWNTEQIFTKIIYSMVQIGK